MVKYSKDEIQRLLNESDTAPDADLKGDKLEELVRYLFEKIPGVQFLSKDVLDGHRAHELDVLFWNDIRYSDLHFLDTIIITECKNTENRLGSNEVGWFVRKLQDRAANNAVLISLMGITGISDGQSNAHSEILSALMRDGIKILLISRDEIQSFKNTNNLVSLLKNKILKLTLERTVV
jgi:hypothetical protein